MTSLLDLDIQSIRSCAPAMSSDDARPYLCGIHVFERDGVIIYEATNGHIAVRVESEMPILDYDYDDYRGLDIILPSFLVGLVCKSKFLSGFGVEGTRVPCSVDATRINLEMIDGVVNYKLMSDMKYPSIDQIIPRHSSITFNKIHVNGKYVDSLARSLSVMTGKPAICLQFTGDRYGCPILVQDDIFPNWTGVLMPMSLFDAEPAKVEEQSAPIDAADGGGLPKLFGLD